MLRLEAKPVPKRIWAIAFTDVGAVEKISAVELDSRLAGPDF